MGPSAESLALADYLISKLGLQVDRISLAYAIMGHVEVEYSEELSYEDRIAELEEALAARQPVGELHLPPDGYYKIVYDDAQVPDESFARTGALDAALRRFEQISERWNAHLFVRFANNTRDCTVPNATPAQAVDLGQMPHGIRLVEIPRRNGLDPINVFVQDYELGRGRIVVTCYGQAWCGFWGAMGDRTVMQFVAACDADYVAGNMLSGRHEHVKKHERTYVERIATEVIAEFRALIDGKAVRNG